MIDSERQLWASVILVALEDALGRVAGVNRQRSKAGRNTVEQCILKAKAWLTKPNSDFNEVCHLAGLDPDATRERAIKLLAKGPGAALKFSTKSATGAPSNAQHFSQLEISK